ncbi:MAG TPA: sigma-70 family RNA polymerase sigma factor [Silvibacterium sp.]|nr:sigma-70 family RNA polymerase sigma factor [Silvibacterium sp.]
MSTQTTLINAQIAAENAVIAQCLNAMDDELLVSAARAGDRSAFVELYERHSRKVLPSIYRITKNREDAEDAFQDAVMRAFVHVKGFEGRSSFTSWLTRIATNSALMVLRKKRGAAEISIDQMCDDTETLRAWEPRDQAETPEAGYARRETEQLLRNAVRRLPPAFRDALELQHAREYSTGQVAAELGISLSAAKSRLMRARKVLRRRLSGTRPRSAGTPRSKQRPLSAQLSSETRS